MTRRTAFAAALVGASLLTPGCGLSWWGREPWDPRYDPGRETRELVLGATLLPLAIPCDLVLSGLVSVGVGMLNPLNWLLVALDCPPMVPVLYVLPTTSIALTLINPDCNLDLSTPEPRGVAGVIHSGLDAEEEEEAEARRRDAHLSPEERTRRARQREKLRQAKEQEEAEQERRLDEHRELQEHLRARNAARRR